MVGSITVNASLPVDASSFSLDYILYDSTANLIFVSDSPLGLVYSSSASLGVGIGRSGSSLIMYEMFYNSELGCWASSLFSPQSSNSTWRDTIGGSSSKSTISFGRFAGHQFYSNGDWGTQYLMKEPTYSNYSCSHTVTPFLDGIELPGGNIHDIINESLNSTTQTTTQAQTIQSNLSTDYKSYQNGYLSSQSLQVSIDNSVNSLNNLNDSQTNTLADLVAINNGLTYAQTVQDKVNADEILDSQTVSPSVQTNINGYITQSNSAYNDFISGTKTQSEAINLIQQQIINLNNMITSGQASSAADVAAVNAAINSVQNTSNSVHNYAELDKSISDKSQLSDQAELNYLDELQSETTSQLQDFAPSKQMNSQQQNEVKTNLLNLIWDNELIKMILPLSGACMIICVALGIKYKL